MADARAAADPQAMQARSMAVCEIACSIPPILKRRFSSSQAAVVVQLDLRRDNQAVLNDDQRQQEQEAQRRLATNFSSAMAQSGVEPRAVADACQVTEQAVSNWKRTGKIKTHFLPIIARLTGWSVHRLVTGEDDPQPPSRRPPDKVDFHARDVTDSEWALLEDLRVMPEEEMAVLRERAAKNRAHVDRVIAQRQAAARGEAIDSPAKKDVER